MYDLINYTKPMKLDDIIGNKILIQSLKEEIKNTTGGIFISGNTGIGKTLAVEIIIKELNAEGVWYDATDLDSDAIDQIDFEGCDIKNLMTGSNSKKIFVIDNADGFPENVNNSLIRKIKSSKHTIVIICNDFYPLKEVEKYCKSFKFINPTTLEIKIFLYKKSINIVGIDNLIYETNNDVRFLLNTLILRNTELRNNGSKKRKRTIIDFFNT